MLIFSILLPAFGSFTVEAAELTGRVTDVETGNVIRDVNVRLIETGAVVPTDKSGEFLFKRIPAGVYRIVATHVAYETSDTISVTAGSGDEIGIRLKTLPWVLNEVVVTGTRSPHLLKNVPVQTEVITTKDFQRTGARTVDEALSSSIGINIKEDFSGQGATIRGIEGGPGTGACRWRAGSRSCAWVD